MKKLLPIIIVLLSILGFVSCGTYNRPSSETTSVSPTPTTTLADTTNNTQSPLPINYEDTTLTINNDVIVLDTNQSKAITLTVTSNTMNTSDLLWESDHPEIASINNEGIVTGLSEGNCLISVSVKDNDTISTSVQITVNGLSSKPTKKPTITQSPKTTQKLQKDISPQKTKAPSNKKKPNSTTAPKETPQPITTQKPTNPPPKKTNTPTKEEVYFDNKIAEEALQLVNRERIKEGLSPLQLKDNITVAAKIRAAEIVTKFDNIRPNGTDASTVLKDCGISNISSQENISAGPSKADNLMENWISSSEYKTNILNPDFKETGIACFVDTNHTYRYYWVQIFIE